MVLSILHWTKTETLRNPCPGHKPGIKTWFISICCYNPAKHPLLGRSSLEYSAYISICRMLAACLPAGLPGAVFYRQRKEDCRSGDRWNGPPTDPGSHQCRATTQPRSTCKAGFRWTIGNLGTAVESRCLVRIYNRSGCWWPWDI